MATKTNEHHALVVSGDFDYGALDKRVADQVRKTAEKIRLKLHKTLQDIIDIGIYLTKAKEEQLPHGQFLPWLHAEFGWAERTARNFMNVAEVFGAKSAKFADLTIQPSAAYFLASPSVPDEARLEAMERAEAGEQITFLVAHSIVSSLKKEDPKKPRGTRDRPAELLRTLERLRDGWGAGNICEFIRLLRIVADETEKNASGPSRRAAPPARRTSPKNCGAARATRI